MIDVACGTGKLSAELAERVGPFGRVLGVDLSPAMVETRAARHPDLVQLEFVIGNALDAPGRGRRVRRGDDRVRPAQPRRLRGRVPRAAAGRPAGREGRLPGAVHAATARLGPRLPRRCSGAWRRSSAALFRHRARVPLPAGSLAWVPAARRAGRHDAAGRPRRRRLPAPRARHGGAPQRARPGPSTGARSALGGSGSRLAGGRAQAPCAARELIREARRRCGRDAARRDSGAILRRHAGGMRRRPALGRAGLPRRLRTVRARRRRASSRPSAAASVARVVSAVGAGASSAASGSVASAASLSGSVASERAGSVASAPTRRSSGCSQSPVVVASQSSRSPAEHHPGGGAGVDRENLSAVVGASSRAIPRRGNPRRLCASLVRGDLLLAPAPVAEDQPDEARAADEADDQQPPVELGVHGRRPGRGPARGRDMAAGGIGLTRRLARLRGLPGTRGYTRGR